MTPAQRTAKLAAIQAAEGVDDDDDDADGDGAAIAQQGGGSSGASSSDEDDSGLGGSAIGLFIILAILWFLWMSVPAIVAMALSWKIAADA
jgi:hypothetical protein